MPLGDLTAHGQVNPENDGLAHRHFPLHFHRLKLRALLQEGVCLHFILFFSICYLLPSISGSEMTYPPLIIRSGAELFWYQKDLYCASI